MYFVIESSDCPVEMVPANKCHLIAVSSVFESMFNGLWAEKDEEKIVDATLGAFKEFFQIYSGRITLTMDHIVEVNNLAKKNDIEQCLEMCEEFFRIYFDEVIVCWAFELATLFDRNRSKTSCEILIGLHAEDQVGRFLGMRTKCFGRYFKIRFNGMFRS